MSHHLVTGGAGFIGSALVHRLVAEGHEVTVLDRFSRGKRERLPQEAVCMSGDVRDPAMTAAMVCDADVIWHLAYVQGTQTFYADPKDVIEVALRGIVNILGACEHSSPTPDVILVSSSEVYQEPPAGMFPTDETVPLSVPDVTNPRYSYGGGKIASELALMAYSQAGHVRRGIIVRPHNVYGPDMGHEHVIPQFADRMLDGASAETRAFPIQGSGEETRSFCYIDDCIDGLMVAYERGTDRTVYHLGNPDEERTIAELAALVAEFYEQWIEIVPGERPQGSPVRRQPDISRLKALGFQPRVSLARGLRHTLQWYAMCGPVAK